MNRSGLVPRPVRDREGGILKLASYRRSWLLGALIALAATLPADAAKHLEPGSRVPELALPTLEGDVRSLRALEGEKYILHVFASW